MKRYRIICPECSAVVFTANPHTTILETCPSCRRHVWDMYDALMADLVFMESGHDVGRSVMA